MKNSLLVIAAGQHQHADTSSPLGALMAAVSGRDFVALEICDLDRFKIGYPVRIHQPI